MMTRSTREMTQTVVFDEDLTACAALVQKGDPDRFHAVMAAPVSARPMLFALYAFNIELSRAPWASQETMIAEMRVQWWRDIGNAIADGTPVRRHFVSTPLSQVLPADLATHIDAMAEARRWDIYKDPFEDEAAFDAYIQNTSGSLMWMAASMLGDADEETVRGYGYAMGLANFLRAIPELENQNRVPLLDGTPEGVQSLAKKGLKVLQNARKGQVSKAARPALLAAWQAKAILAQAAREPHRVGKGALGQSEFTKRAGLLWHSLLGF